MKDLFTAPDKQKHIIAGGLVVILCVLLGYGVWSLAAAAVVGALKELYDKFTPGRVVDFWDFVATALPGLPVTIYYVLGG